MTTSQTRELVRTFFEVRMSYDPEKIAPLIDDDIEWSICGPIDLLHYAGYRRGKQAVLDAIVLQKTGLFQVNNIKMHAIVVDGDKAMTQTRLSGVHGVTGHAISYECAQFLRFRDGKLVQFRGIIDSFDATQQVLGREIDIDSPMTSSINARPALGQQAG